MAPQDLKEEPDDEVRGGIRANLLSIKTYATFSHGTSIPVMETYV